MSRQKERKRFLIIKFEGKDMKNNLVTNVFVFGLAAASLMAQPQTIRLIDLSSSTTITQSGSYLLTTSLAVNSATGAGLLITGSNITVDLNGQTITGTGTGAGVMVMGGRNVVVKNGNIESALMGAVAMNATGVRFENLMIRGNAGAPPEAGVMLVQTSGSVVANNQIFNAALGIFVRGSRTFGNRIEGNIITATGSTLPLGICYNPTDTDMTGPQGDLITRNLIRGYRQSVAFSNSSFNVVEGNTFIFRVSASDNPNSKNMIKNNTEVKIEN